VNVHLRLQKRAVVSYLYFGSEVGTGSSTSLQVGDLFGAVVLSQGLLNSLLKRYHLVKAVARLHINRLSSGRRLPCVSVLLLGDKKQRLNCFTCSVVLSLIFAGENGRCS